MSRTAFPSMAMAMGDSVANTSEGVESSASSDWKEIPNNNMHENWSNDYIDIIANMTKTSGWIEYRVAHTSRLNNGKLTCDQVLQFTIVEWWGQLNTTSQRAGLAKQVKLSCRHNAELLMNLQDERLETRRKNFRILVLFIKRDPCKWRIMKTYSTQLSFSIRTASQTLEWIIRQNFHQAIESSSVYSRGRMLCLTIYLGTFCVLDMESTLLLQLSHDQPMTHSAWRLRCRNLSFALKRAVVKVWSGWMWIRVGVSELLSHTNAGRPIRSSFRNLSRCIVPRYNQPLR